MGDMSGGGEAAGKRTWLRSPFPSTSLSGSCEPERPVRPFVIVSGMVMSFEGVCSRHLRRAFSVARRAFWKTADNIIVNDSWRFYACSHQRTRGDAEVDGLEDEVVGHYGRLRWKVSGSGKVIIASIAYRNDFSECDQADSDHVSGIIRSRKMSRLTRPKIPC